MRDHLQPFAEEIAQMAQKEGSIVEQAALLWKLCYYMVMKFRERRPEWLYLRHEDMSRNPEESFRQVYDWLGIEYSDDIRRKISEFSGPHNPSEADRPDCLKLNSRANIENWRIRLDPSEIAHVRSITGEVAGEFYSDSEW
jgi:predicted LPLAT superfamily acyltransferase